MCFKKRKPKVEINSKFKVSQMVNFHYRNEICPGFIYNVKLNNEGQVIYDIQIGGECPAIVHGVSEDKIFLNIRR